jgi:hypothetical protein
MRSQFCRALINRLDATLLFPAWVFGADIWHAEYHWARIYGHAELIWKAMCEFHPTGLHRSSKVVMAYRFTSTSSQIRLVDALASIEN